MSGWHFPQWNYGYTQMPGAPGVNYNYYQVAMHSTVYL